MKTKRIKKSIEINAPKEKVWNVLLDDQYTRLWYAAFSEGSHAETDWKEGSKAVFTDNTHSGLISKVTKNKPYEVLSLEYQGVVTGGKEDYESQLAQEIKGGLESYQLTEKDGITSVSIESDMGEEFFDSMSDSWENALKKVKQLSEEKLIVN